jgi:hypothetical protein
MEIFIEQPFAEEEPLVESLSEVTAQVDFLDNGETQA